MIRTPISDLGCEQAPPGCEVEKTDEVASVSSGSAGGMYQEGLRIFIDDKIVKKLA